MINIVAIALLISSLAAAGIWSPPPNSGDPPPPPLREGHRLIVVEYERELPSNQPPPFTTTTTTHKIIEQAKEKLHEASSVLPNVGQGISTPGEIDSGSPRPDIEKPTHSAKELICDAYGSCKEKITTAFQTGKEKISQKASEIEENAKDAVERGTHNTAEKITGAFRKGKEKVSPKASEVEEGEKDAVESGAHDVGGNLSRLSEAAVETAEGFGRGLTETVNRIKKSVVDFDVARAGMLVAWMVHMVGFAVAYGTSMWVTFVSSHVLASGLPRQQFGVVQSKVYPVYFRVVACGVVAAWAGHWFGRGAGSSKGRWEGVGRVEGYNLVVALGLVLINMWHFEPKATKVMFERMKMEKEGKGRDMADIFRNEPVVAASTATATTQATTIGGPTRTTVTADQEAAVKSRVVKLSKKLKKLNTYSSFLNLLALMSLTWHLVHLARRLQMTC